MTEVLVERWKSIVASGEHYVIEGKVTSNLQIRNLTIVGRNNKGCVSLGQTSIYQLEDLVKTLSAMVKVIKGE